MTNPKLEEVMKQLVLAHADGEIQSIAVLFVNDKGEPEIELAIGPDDFYKINTALDILKFNILSRMMDKATKKPKERE